MTNDKDTIFRKPRQNDKGFHFDEMVAQVFPDMIGRSVPGYHYIIKLSGLIAKRFAQSDTAIYDLGCALGATTFAMAESVDIDTCHFYAIDNSRAMIKRAEEICKDRLSAMRQINWIIGDITQQQLVPASVVAMNFTLQFVDKKQRSSLIEKIFNALVPGGVLIIAEKIEWEESTVNTVLTDLHLDFKRANGYSELEIAGKRQAIEKVLVPESIAVHTKRLQTVGFSTIADLSQCLNFKAWLAIK